MTEGEGDRGLRFIFRVCERSNGRYACSPQRTTGTVSLSGGAIGLWGSVALLRGLSMWQPVPRYPISLPVTPDTNVYVVALLLALVSGLLFGLVPVRQVLRSDPYQIVKGDGAERLGGALRCETCCW